MTYGEIADKIAPDKSDLKKCPLRRSAGLSGTIRYSEERYRAVTEIAESPFIIGYFTS